jgi:hypothetical protein
LLTHTKLKCFSGRWLLNDWYNNNNRLVGLDGFYSQLMALLPANDPPKVVLLAYHQNDAVPACHDANGIGLKSQD